MWQPQPRTISRRKNRKRHFDTNQFNRHHRMKSTLSKELRKKHGIRSLTANKDDFVKVISGKHKNKTGKVLKVSLREYKLYIDGCEQIIGNKRIADPIHHSNVMITSLNLQHKSREHAIKRRAEANARKIAAMKERSENYVAPVKQEAD